jgi:radical SAM protein with 4Fe4S-binding SPASM domain
MPLLFDRGLKKGLYTFEGMGEMKGHRFHLRVDSDQKGVLIVDASKLIFLNGTAIDYVRCILDGRGEAAALKYMRRRYKKLDKDTAAKDYAAVLQQFKQYMEGSEEVIDNIGSDTPLVGADALPAPYRVDLALTYDCQNECGHCYNENDAEEDSMNPQGREERTSSAVKKEDELTLDQWKSALYILWKASVPHIVFTGGEPTLSPHLRELIEASESIGQITGLITNGRNLGKDGYLEELVEAGLDHVQITLLSHKESVHDKLAGQEGAWKETVEGIKAAIAEDLYASTNTTIMKTTATEIEETMRFLVSLGVKNISFNGIIRSGEGKNAEAVELKELEGILARLQQIAKESDVKLIWYTPTPYCEFNPINHGLGIKQCTACSINMAIEPNGNVLPCQSYYESVGNILDDDWDDIWNHGLCKKIRERGYLPEKCDGCELIDACGGGCPLSIEHGDYLCMDRYSG